MRDADVVLDTIGGDTLDRSWTVLRKGEKIVTTVGPALTGKAAQYGVHGIFFIVQPSRAQLIQIGQLIDAGYIRPVVAGVLPLNQARDLFVQDASHHTGKLVLPVVAES